MNPESYWLVLKERVPSVAEPLVSRADITRWFDDALAAQRTPLLSWVGPPRVTRLGGLTERYSVRAARLLRLAPGNVADPAAHVRNVVFQMNELLNTYDYDPGLPVVGTPTPNWSAALVSPWSQAANGPVGWWANGTAANTLTMNRASTASDARAENPVGPDDATTRIGGAPGSPQDDKYGRWLTTIAWGAGVVAVSLVLVKGLTLATVLSQGSRSASILVGPTSPVRQLPAPRSNPPRRRRANRHPR
jgi:hypothetical protein